MVESNKTAHMYTIQHCAPFKWCFKRCILLLVFTDRCVVRVTQSRLCVSTMYH